MKVLCLKTTCVKWYSNRPKVCWVGHKSDLIAQSKLSVRPRSRVVLTKYRKNNYKKKNVNKESD